MSKPFTKIHVALMVLAVALLVVGFWMLAQAPWNNPVGLTYGPVLLVFVFVVAFPAALLFPTKKIKEDPRQDS